MEVEIRHKLRLYWYFIVVRKVKSFGRWLKETWYKIRYWKLRKRFIHNVNYTPSITTEAKKMVMFETPLQPAPECKAQKEFAKKQLN